MDTDDDIFIIHNRTLVYFKSLISSKKSCLEKQRALITRLLSHKVPHGFTENKWIELSKKYCTPYVLTSNKKITYKECKEIIQECTNLEESHTYDQKFNLYTEISKEILKDFKNSITDVIHADFMDVFVKKESLEKNKQVALKSELIRAIEEILGTFAMNQIIARKITVKKGGSDHQQELSEAAKDHDGVIEDDWNGMVYNDLNRISFNQKFKYDKRQHFKDTLNQYQGLQRKNIPDAIIHSLIDMIEKLGLTIPNKTLPQERYAKVTKDHIKMFLAETNNPLYYEDRILIYSKITGTPCPDIQHVEKALFQDFDKLVEVFLNFSDKLVDRKNFLNTHYVLRQLLKKQGIIVSEDSLNNLKTPARIKSHDDIYQLCCEKLGWNFTPLG
jgi:hypothetical protein